MATSITGFWIFPPLLRAFGHYYLLSVLSVQNLIFVILWGCYCYGGLSSPTLAWIATIPLLAFMYVGHSVRMRIVLIAQFMLNMIAYWAISVNFAPPPVTLAQSASQALGLVSIAAASLYVTMMALTYANALASQVELQTEVERHLVTAADLLAATEEARRSGTAKSDFIARMSHELRAPLNAIIGYSEMLLEDAEGDDDATTVSDLGRIRDAGKYLLKLVNRILDLSRAEAGRMEIANEWLDCIDLVNGVVNEVGPLIEKNGDAVSVVKQGNPGLIYTNSVKLKQVLTNLLENAAQYTQNGAITVTVGRAAAEGGDEIVFSVADSGAEIEPARLPLVLNSFETLDDDDHRSNGGAGLGLALAKKFCELIAGKLSVESEVGRGSVFTLTLPANVNAPSAAANDESLAQALGNATEGLNAVASAMRNAGRKDMKGSLAHAKAAAG